MSEFLIERLKSVFIGILEFVSGLWSIEGDIADWVFKRIDKLRKEGWHTGDKDEKNLEDVSGRQS